MHDLELTVEEREPGVPVVAIQGEVDLHNSPKLRKELLILLDSGKNQIILDMTQVPYLDSAALGVLVDAVRRARENKGGIYLVNVVPFVLRAFEITRLIKIFETFDSVDAALAAAVERNRN